MRFCDAKAMELHTEVLTFVPRCERQGYVEMFLNDYRKEARLASTAARQRSQREEFVSATGSWGGRNSEMMSQGVSGQWSAPDQQVAFRQAGGTRSGSAGPSRRPMQPHRLNEGMKTSLTSTPNPCFSLPSSFGACDAAILHKQRKVERDAMIEASRIASRGGRVEQLSSRRLPW